MTPSHAAAIEPHPEPHTKCDQLQELYPQTHESLEQLLYTPARRVS